MSGSSSAVQIPSGVTTSPTQEFISTLGDTRNNGGAGATASSSGSSFHYSYRDRLMHIYGCLFNQCVVVSFMLLSLFLLMLNIAAPVSVTLPWYHGLELVVTFVFVLEVALRMIVARAAFWSSLLNIVECSLCAMCVLVMVAIESTPVAYRAEHSSLALMRFAAQVMRLIALLRKQSATSAMQSSVLLAPFDRLPGGPQHHKSSSSGSQGGASYLGSGSGGGNGGGHYRHYANAAAGGQSAPVWAQLRQQYDYAKGIVGGAGTHHGTSSHPQSAELPGSASV